MLQLSDPERVRAECAARRAEGARVGLVPTMGYLHQGHLALVRRARELCPFVVVSIFVNPTQFGPGEDLERYPRDLEQDLAGCRKAGAALVFTPKPAQLYPEGYQTYVQVLELSQGLCGASRPTHFRGVATICTKLFCIVGPCLAVFGQKDYQQLLVIRRLVEDLQLPVEVVGHPTVREPDGLAMSSRNAYLTPPQRRSAPCLHRALSTVRQRVRAAGGAGLEAGEALALAQGVIEAEPGTRIDYVELRDAETLQPVQRALPGRAVMLLAVHLGQARLIDNMLL
jgi:pantoate--beta-alanine ligase